MVVKLVGTKAALTVEQRVGMLADLKETRMATPMAA